MEIISIELNDHEKERIHSSRGIAQQWNEK